MTLPDGILRSPGSFGKSVFRELRSIQGLLTVASRDLDPKWSQDVLAYDACESGHATVRGAWTVGDVQSVGRWHERWRFKNDEDPAGFNPRANALKDVSALGVGVWEDKEVDFSNVY
eukprot:5380949-Pyramimonas_sp.AAC.1